MDPIGVRYLWVRTKIPLSCQGISSRFRTRGAARIHQCRVVDSEPGCLQRLQQRLNRDQLAYNQGLVGKTCSVLVERKGKHPGQWLGKSPWLTSVWFEGEAEIGDLVEVELVEAGPNSIQGALRETVST